jgi:hypothetical protein
MNASSRTIMMNEHKFFLKMHPHMPSMKMHGRYGEKLTIANRKSMNVSLKGTSMGGFCVGSSISEGSIDTIDLCEYLLERCSATKDDHEREGWLLKLVSLCGSHVSYLSGKWFLSLLSDRDRTLGVSSFLNMRDQPRTCSAVLRVYLELLHSHDGKKWPSVGYKLSNVRRNADWRSFSLIEDLLRSTCIMVKSISHLVSMAPDSTLILVGDGVLEFTRLYPWNMRSSTKAN